MGTPSQSLDRPPSLPPEVTTQMGGGETPFSGMGAMMQKKPAPGGPETAAHPQGMLLASAEAVEKVLTNVAKANEKFAPFATKAIAQIKAGVAACTGASPGADAISEAGSPPVPKAPEGELKGFPG